MLSDDVVAYAILPSPASLLLLSSVIRAISNTQTTSADLTLKQALLHVIYPLRLPTLHGVCPRCEAQMPICIECRFPVSTLYTSYSKADDRTLGKGVRLTQCPRCKRFADKYVEHDFVILFIDLVLIKPQVYRHLLFNRLRSTDNDDNFDPSVIRLGVLLLLFDVYLTWARIEKAAPQDVSQSSLSSWPLLLQYLFFLVLCLSSTVAFHLPMRLLTGWSGSWIPGVASSSAIAPRLLPYYPHGTAISTALIVSSCTKLFPILLIIWDYDLPSAASAVSWAVITNNVAAVEILMDCGLVRAAILVLIGALCRAAVGYGMLSLIGLQDRSWGLDGVGVLMDTAGMVGKYVGML